MLEAINRFFRSQIAPAESSAVDQAQRLQVATCALLLEAAHADQQFSPEERELVSDLVRRRFGLTDRQAGELMALADQEREQSTDLYQFARLINEQLTRAQKLAVLKQLWQVVYTDGRLEAHEDALLHKVCRLLDLTHRELIALKLQVKGQDRADPV